MDEEKQNFMLAKEDDGMRTLFSQCHRHMDVGWVGLV
jgi:hypothetical protein